MKRLSTLICLLLLAFIAACGGGSKSNNQVTQTPQAPSAPAGLAATAGDAQVALSWTAVSGATSYNVYYGTSSSVSTSTGTKISGITTTSTTVSSLTDGTTYYFIVTAVNSGGESTAATAVASTPKAAVAAAPTGLTATAGDAQVALSWTASAGAISYNVYYSTSSAVSPSNGTQISGITATSTTVKSLTNGTTYYFIVTAVNSGGESAASATVSAMPTLPTSAGIVINLTPGSAASGTLAANSTTSLTYTFGASAVNQDAAVNIVPVTQSNLPVALAQRRRLRAMQNTAGGTFIASFTMSVSPSSITAFNTPVVITGSVSSSVQKASTVNLAMLQEGAWVDVATFVIGSGSSLNENIPSYAVPGVLAPGSYVLYQPAPGTNTTVSNLGIVLMPSDGNTMGNSSTGLQAVQFYGSNGNLLQTPTLTNLAFGTDDADAEGLTPDGSMGLVVDGATSAYLFSGTQTGSPSANTTAFDLTGGGNYSSYNFGSVATLPTGDEAVAAGRSIQQLIVVSGILSGALQIAQGVTVPDDRDGVVISSDGTVLLARGQTGLTVFSVAYNASATPAYTFTQTVDLPSLGTNPTEQATNLFTQDGRNGMAISPVDSSRAVIISRINNTVQMLTGLPNNPVAGSPITLQTGIDPRAVAISPDGTLAVVAGAVGMALYGGVNTGNLQQIEYIPDLLYTLNGTTVGFGSLTTVGFTLDGQYIVVGDYTNAAVVLVPFSSSGFGTTAAAVLGQINIPDGDQMLVH